ncbi:MAG: ATP-binding protein [Chthoniobacteraceae bacterium]
MKFFSYVPLLGGIFNLVLALFVFGSDRRSRLNQVFFAWALSISIWNFGTFELFQKQDIQNAYAWAKFMQFGVIFIPVTMLHLCLLLSGYKPGRWLVLTYCFHGVLALMNAFDLFISGVRHVGYAYYSVAGIGFKIYGIAFVQSFASIILLWKKRRAVPPMQRGRFNAILAAQTLLVVLGTNDLLPIYGVDFYPFTHAHIIPYGSLAAVAYGVMVAYSVFQHQLLDVRFTLGRSGAYLVRFLFLALIAVLLNLVVATFAPAGQMTAFSLLSSIAVIVVSALLATLLFPKLLGGNVETLERRLMGDHFEYQDKIRAFIERCRWHTELDALLDDLHSLLLNTLNVRGYSLILRDETNRAFTLVRSHPADAPRQIPELSTDSPAFQFFSVPKNSYLPLGSGYAHERDPLEASAREQLKAIPGVLAFPFLVDLHPLGFLILDEKANDRTFTRTDIQLLCELTTNVALVINQVSLKNQLLQAKELELLGRMSQGMAHDLNNLTTPVWTLLQLLTEGVSSDSLRSELAPVAIRNIQTMREYIREALFFSENLRPDFRAGRLDVLVQEVIELARQNNRRGRDIQYSLRLAGDVLVEMDQVLIRRLLSNVIANAVDASQQRGLVEVEVVRLVKTDPEYDWYRVRVIDYGTGIPQENLNHIFQPYFTTKKTGDQNRGFGLGLAICRKIAALHGGSLMVSSELGRGTTVNLDLPNRHKKQKLPRAPESLSSKA